MLYTVRVCIHVCYMSRITVSSLGLQVEARSSKTPGVLNPFLWWLCSFHLRPWEATVPCARSSVSV